jgi:uncharacterized protein YuzE
MDVTYDKVADALYMKLSNGKVSKTLEINESLNVDIDEHGQTVGIEVLDVSSQKDFAENLQENVAKGIPVSINDGIPSGV